MGKKVTIDVEVEHDILKVFEALAAKHKNSVEEEIAIALTEALATLTKIK